MPLFRCKGQLHWFAHIPKCAGQSVESYLEARFGSLAFLNNDFGALPKERRWSKSSPQHIDGEAIKLLFPTDWIETSFAVVRHPVARAVSAFNFANLEAKNVPSGMSFDEWFRAYETQSKQAPHLLDQHLRAQSEMVLDDTKIFKLENGLEAVVDWLDTLAGNTDGPRAIGKHNQAKPDSAGAAFKARKLPNDVISRLTEKYAKDFERFDYSPQVDRDYVVYECVKPDRSLPWYQRTATWRTLLRKYHKATARALT